MDDNDVFRRIGQAYLAEHPTPWWLDASADPLGALLAHPSRAVAVYMKRTMPNDELTEAAFDALAFPYDGDGIALFGPRFAVTYAMRSVDPRREPRPFYDFVTEADTDATVQLALGLWDRSSGSSSPCFLLGNVFDTARRLTAPSA